MDIYTDLYYQIYVIYYAYMAIYVHICHIYAQYMYVPYGMGLWHGFCRNFFVEYNSKEFRKSANICQSYERVYSGTVFDSLCITWL